MKIAENAKCHPLAISANFSQVLYRVYYMQGKLLHAGPEGCKIMGVTCNIMGKTHWQFKLFFFKLYIGDIDID